VGTKTRLQKFTIIVSGDDGVIVNGDDGIDYRQAWTMCGFILGPI